MSFEVKAVGKKSLKEVLTQSSALITAQYSLIDNRTIRLRLNVEMLGIKPFWAADDLYLRDSVSLILNEIFEEHV